MLTFDESLPLPRSTFCAIICGVIIAEPNNVLSTIGGVKPTGYKVSGLALKLSSIIALTSNSCGVFPIAEVSPHAPLYDKQIKAESKPELDPLVTPKRGLLFTVSPEFPK